MEKVGAIEGCPQPRTRKELRSFLGMAGFYNKFVPNFSSRAAVLTDMVGLKGVPISSDGRERQKQHSGTSGQP